MEKRVVLAAMLMAGLLMLYQTFFLSSPAETPQQQKSETQAKTATSPVTTTPGAMPAPPGTPAPAVAAPAAARAAMVLCRSLRSPPWLALRLASRR